MTEDYRPHGVPSERRRRSSVKHECVYIVYCLFICTSASLLVTSLGPALSQHAYRTVLDLQMCLIAIQMCVWLRFWISRCVFDCGSGSPDVCLIAVLDLQMCVWLRFWISRCVFDCDPDVCLIAIQMCVWLRFWISRCVFDCGSGSPDVCLIAVLDLQMCVRLWFWISRCVFDCGSRSPDVC